MDAICEGCMEKLRRPMPSSNFGEGSVSLAISPQTLTSCRPRAPGDRQRDELQHRRVPRVVEMSHGLVGAIDRQRVLDEVVGAQRDEVEVAQERRHDQPPPALRSSRRPRCRQRVDGRRRELLFGARERVARRAAPRQVRDHGTSRRTCHARWHAGWRAAAGGTSRLDRLQRIARSPIAGFSACSWTQLVDRHPVQRLVGADVHRPDRHRKALHRLDDRAVGFEPFVLARQLAGRGS